MLLVKLAEQGATVVAYTAIDHAISMVGRDNVFMMVFDENRFIVDELGLIPEQNVITVSTTGPLRMVVSALQAVRAARRCQVDTAVDFEFFSRASAILVYLSGARRRIGHHSYSGEGSWRGDLMTHRLAYNPRLHAAETFVALVSAVVLRGDDLPVLDLELPTPAAPPQRALPSAAEVEGIERMLDALLGGRFSRRVVILNPNAGDLVAQRRWPMGRYIELAGRLLDRSDDIVVVVTGASAEAAQAVELVGAVDSARCVSVAGRTSMRDLLVLYSCAQLLITNDSGPAQYAALADIDVVTLFGPESPHVFASLSARSHVVWAELPCSPCVNAFNDRRSTCVDNRCMQRIDVGEVYQVADRLLSSSD